MGLCPLPPPPPRITPLMGSTAASPSALLDPAFVEQLRRMDAERRRRRRDEVAADPVGQWVVAHGDETLSEFLERELGAMEAA